MILFDTSVWIEVLRARRPLDLEATVDLGEIVACPPVIQEDLQGIRDERAHRLAREALLAFPIVESPMPVDVRLQAADLFRAARRVGVTVRSSIDGLIAAIALRHDLEVLHHDRDFEHLARIAPLRVRRA